MASQSTNGKLPQTGDNNSSNIAGVGLGLGLLGVIGLFFKGKKKTN
ncbi:LPXTG cell wall anchor domain-containing protein [Lactococcus lactis]